MLVKKLTINGTKAIQREDREDRLRDYKQWIYDQPKLYASDIDQIEWGYQNNQEEPVAVLELTRIDREFKPSDKYFEAIIHRFFVRDTQARRIIKVANRLGVDAYIVAFLQDLSGFSMYNLCKQDGWKHISPQEYLNWHYQIRGLNGMVKTNYDPFLD